MRTDKFDCIVCKKEFPRRVKGMRDRAYKDNLRPYRCLTCSTRCAVLYNRMPLSKRNLLKAQGGIIKMEQFNTEVMLNEENILKVFDDDRGFGIELMSDEKHNPNAVKGSNEKYYHDIKFWRNFQKKENLVKFIEGLKLINEACLVEWELETDYGRKD